MRVDLLCSGSKGNACLIQSGSTRILIDCGPSTKRYMKNSLQECGVEPEDLDAVLITHSHSDHIRQLAMFAKIPIYACCPLSVKNSKGEPVALNLHPIKPPQPMRFGRLKVLSFPTSHDSGPSMGFVVEEMADEHSSKVRDKLVYVTDTGYLPAAVFPLLSGAESYIFESNHDLEMLEKTRRPYSVKQRIVSDTGHLCNQDAARLLARFISKKTRRIILAHLSEENNTPELALSALHEKLQACHIDCSKIDIQAAAQWEPVRFETTPADPEKSEPEGASLQANEKPQELPVFYNEDR